MILNVFIDKSDHDETAICISRTNGFKIEVLKMEVGEQAYVLYRLLTEQMTKAKILTEEE